MTAVWVDGVLTDAAGARVGALDHGITVGDGVFETLKVVDGTPFALRRHLARLRRSAGMIGLRLAVSDDELRAAAAAAVSAAAGAGDVGRVRITVTGGTGPLSSDRHDVAPTVIVAAGPGGAWEAATPRRHRAVDPQRAQRGGRRQDDVLRRERGRSRLRPRAGRQRSPARQLRRGAVRRHRLQRVPRPRRRAGHAVVGHGMPRRHHPRADPRAHGGQRARPTSRSTTSAAPTRCSSPRPRATSRRCPMSTTTRCRAAPDRSPRRRRWRSPSCTDATSTPEAAVAARRVTRR